MALDKATVARIAALARIDVPDEDQDALATELSNILGWIEQLNEVDTDNVEPMRKVMPIERAWRPDLVVEGDAAAAITGNAPKAHGGYFVVPKAVE